ncbi:MAG TPA: TerC family protein [Plasticicumulans sp.]|uniref:TerC family protein n=1 Tax=Plasticicumulans sp. TaxID=2307179 RepID=UPI002C4565A7|nr:TerC family protein [Plasticicumulans sp.]MBS0603070.1 TerC family protein [Pseudomonadota bacterium]HMW29090.1 TerC family protein [Plasticicumulans sp.]HMW41088.1 TerC family protein [Plasticicumulans sp.]HNF65362.1 TerC family protein [Plasticicumulans sp.]HNG48180.1 TerC family protein [Plasticicumulans sp.]
MPELEGIGGWLFAVLQIIAIDILLGGDNAVVIALACRRLPEDKRRLGVRWGVAGAIVLRIVMIAFALQLLLVPGLKLIGAALLLWIGIKLLQPEADDGHDGIEGGTTLLAAVRTVIVADAVMSIDNVVAVAAAARGELALVVFGILVSVPIIVWGSHFVLRLMDRFPVIIVIGGALLGWIAGGLAVHDPLLERLGFDAPDWAHWPASLVGALAVVLIGRQLAARAGRAAPAPLEDLLSEARRDE